MVQLSAEGVEMEALEEALEAVFQVLCNNIKPANRSNEADELRYLHQAQLPFYTRYPHGFPNKNKTCPDDEDYFDYKFPSGSKAGSSDQDADVEDSTPPEEPVHVDSPQSVEN